MNIVVLLVSIVLMHVSTEQNQTPAHYFADDGQQIIVMPDRWVEKRRFAHMYQASKFTISNNQLTSERSIVVETLK